MHQLADTLTQTILFRSIPADIIEAQILPHGFLQSYAKDQLLIVPQQQVDRFGIVISGKIHIQHLFTNGTCRLMRTVSERELLGADLICTKTRISPYHAAAASPVQIFSLPAAMLTTPGFLEEPIRLELLNRLQIGRAHV